MLNQSGGFDMMTVTSPSYINNADNIRIETVYPDNLSNFSYFDDSASIYFLSESDIKTTDESFINTKPELPTFQGYFLMKAFENLYSSIKKEQDRFLEEEVNLPNQHAIDLTCEVLNLLSTQDIFPAFITPSIEEGICLVFSKTKYKIYFEIYNNGEIGYIIEDTISKITIDNEDLGSVKQIPAVIEKFFQ